LLLSMLFFQQYSSYRMAGSSEMANLYDDDKYLSFKEPRHEQVIICFIVSSWNYVQTKTETEFCVFLKVLQSSCTQGLIKSFDKQTPAANTVLFWLCLTMTFAFLDFMQCQSTNSNGIQLSKNVFEGAYSTHYLNMLLLLLFHTDMCYRLV
jgi:hypothetical protein